MPSSVGHAMAAMSLGWVAGERVATRGELLLQAALLSGLGSAPDLDLLVGRHRAESHSIGAVVAVAAAAAAFRLPVASTRVRIAVIAGLAYGSHLVLDVCGVDLAVPRGIMAFWPLSTTFVTTGWDIFLPISRRWYAPDFLTVTLIAIAREVVLLGPALLAVAWWRWPRRPRRPRDV